MSIYSILSSKPHNKHYLDRYIKFISSCNKFNSNNNQNYTEIHHICPKAKDLFPQYKNLTLNPWNKVTLSGRQHYIAHNILSKIYPWSNVIFGYKRMLVSTVHRDANVRVTSTEYERIKQSCSQKQSKNAKEWLKTNDHPRGFLNKTHSEETKKIMSSKTKGAKNPMFGKIRNDLIEINKDEKIAAKKGISGSKSKQLWKIKLFGFTTELELYQYLNKIIEKNNFFRINRKTKERVVDFKKLQKFLNKPISVKSLFCFYCNKRIVSLVDNVSTLA